MIRSIPRVESLEHIALDAVVLQNRLDRADALGGGVIGALRKRPHLGGRILTWGRRVPASALPSWGSMPQLGNKKMYCICLSRHRALPSKCRRGDASPPGEDVIPPSEDAILLAMKKINDRLMFKTCSRASLCVLIVLNAQSV